MLIVPRTFVVFTLHCTTYIKPTHRTLQIHIFIYHIKPTSLQIHIFYNSRSLETRARHRLSWSKSSRASCNFGSSMATARGTRSKSAMASVAMGRWLRPSHLQCATVWSMRPVGWSVDYHRLMDSSPPLADVRDDTGWVVCPKSRVEGDYSSRESNPVPARIMSTLLTTTYFQTSSVQSN